MSEQVLPEKRYSVSVEVNGVQRTTSVTARRSLVDFLREDLRLTGTHIGCDTTQCGCCTVHLNDRAVKSCTVLAAQAEALARAGVRRVNVSLDTRDRAKFAELTRRDSLPQVLEGIAAAKAADARYR